MSFSQHEGSGITSAKFRIGLHLGMGTIYLFFGVLVMYVKYFGAMELPSGVAYTMGTLLLIYGAFRIIRGILDLRNLRQNR